MQPNWLSTGSITGASFEGTSITGAATWSVGNIFNPGIVSWRSSCKDSSNSSSLIPKSSCALDKLLYGPFLIYPVSLSTIK